MDMNITFDSTAKEDILHFFAKEINDGGIIVETESKESVIALDGSEVCSGEFAGIKSGSEIFLKKDLISMMKLSEESK